MPVKAIKPGYHGEFRDRVENFRGQQLLNICWEKHTMFGWPMCIPVPPEMPFGALLEQVLPGIYGAHPDFARIKWNEVQWATAKGPFTPDPSKSMVEHGFKHKTQIRFRTPGLDGHNGAG